MRLVTPPIIKSINKICTLTHLSKQQYYSNFFNDNLTNMKKTWEGINNVLARKLKNTNPITFIKDPNDNDSVTSDSSRIANVRNVLCWPQLFKQWIALSTG